MLRKHSCMTVHGPHREGGRTLKAGAGNCDLLGRISLSRKLSATEHFDLYGQKGQPSERAQQMVVKLFYTS